MAVKLRLMRMGKKKQPTYRVVAADTRAARNGGFIEILGTYQPRLDPAGFQVDDAKVLKWLRNGALPSERVEKLLRISGTWELFESGAEAPEPAADTEADAAEEAATEAAAPEASNS